MRFEVAKNRLGCRLYSMLVPDVVSDLFHQRWLVVRGKLRTTLFMAAHELVHCHSFSDLSINLVGRR